MEKKKIKMLILVGIVLILLGGVIGFLRILDGAKTLITEYCINVKRVPVSRTPLEYGIDYKEMKIEIEPGIKIHAWYIPSNYLQPLIILIPGYKGTRESLLPWIEFLHNEGYSLLAIDPRGQGESNGNSICGAYLAQDLGKIIQFFKEENINQFVLFGLSLGGVGAIIAGAQNKEVIGVISDSAFASMREGLRHSPSFEGRIFFDNFLLYTFLKHFAPQYIYKTLGESIDFLKETNALLYVKKVKNLLLLHGKNDTLIPPENAYLLFKESQKTPGIKKLWIYQGDHVEGLKRNSGEYKKEVTNFIKQILEGKSLLFSFNFLY